MFKEPIVSTPLTTNAANKFYEERVFGDTYLGDFSFIATVRALVYPRMADEETLFVNFSGSSYSQGQIENVTATQLFEAVVNYRLIDPGYTGSIQIHNFGNGISENDKYCMEIFEKEFTNVYKDWFRVDRVTDFFRSAMNMMCFVNPETRNVLILCEKLDLKKLHYLECGTVAYFPWYFTQEEGITDLERELIESLRKQTPKDYLACLQKFADQHDFRSEYIKSGLRDFESVYEKNEIERCKESVRNAMAQINDLASRITDYLRTKKDLEIRILGLEESMREKKENILLEYFLANKSLNLDRVTGSQITFSIKDYLEFWDEDAAEAMIDNRNSYVYYFANNSNVNKDDLEELFRSVFLDRKLKIRVCAAYQIDMSCNYRPSGVQGYNFDSSYTNYLPNPHIEEYGCTGDNTAAILEFLNRGDSVGAVQQCVASAKQLNFSDHVVMERFCTTMVKTGRDFIELPDGSVTNPRGAMKWLREQKGESDE